MSGLRYLELVVGGVAEQAAEEEGPCQVVHRVPLALDRSGGHLPIAFGFGIILFEVNTRSRYTHNLGTGVLISQETAFH